MLGEWFVGHVETALRGAGLKAYSLFENCRGFSLFDTSESIWARELLLHKLSVFLPHGVLLHPAGFGNIDGPEQMSAIEEGNRYKAALAEMGLESYVFVLSPGPDDITSFGVYVYVPIEQEVRRGVGDKLQVHFRVTAYGQREGHTLRDDVVAELTVDTDESGNGWRALAAAPHHCRGSQEIFQGRGESRRAAVVNWLHQLLRSPSYFPAHREAKDRNRAAGWPDKEK